MICLGSGFTCPALSPSTPQGGTRSIHNGKSDGASYCKPKKYMSLKFYIPKIPGIKIFNPQKIQDLITIKGFTVFNQTEFKT